MAAPTTPTPSAAPAASRTRRGLFGAGAAVAIALAAPRLALAQGASWPVRPLRWVIGFAPGGVGDLSTRLVAQRLGSVLGQTVVIENRPSAGGIIAAETVARAPADGHTLHLMTTSDSTAAAIYRRLPYDMFKDFEFVSTMAFFDLVLATGANSPYRTLADVIAAAKAQPGTLNLGSISVGNAQHLAAEFLRALAGIDMTVVPYRGTPDLLNATATGDVHLACEVLAPVLPQVQGGRLRALAIASTQRFPGLPDVPTVEEAGVPGFVARSWNGIAMRAGTPRPIVERLNGELARVLAMPDLREKLLELGVQPAPAAPPEAFRDFVTQENAFWARIVAEANIPKQ